MWLGVVCVSGFGLISVFVDEFDPCCVGEVVADKGSEAVVDGWCEYELCEADRDCDHRTGCEELVPE